MGAAWSYITRISTSSRIESEPIIAPSAEFTQGRSMAEASNPRDAASQHNTRTCFSREDLNRYTNALQICHEFLNISGSMVERQRILETELETCHERLRRFTEDHARLSESGNENISSSNRPSAVERNYEQFYDHERMDAIECLENSRIKKELTKRTEIEDQRVACMMFEDSFVAAQALRESFLESISWIMTSAPVIGAQYFEAKTKKSDQVWLSVKTDRRPFPSLGQSDINSLKAIMKETAENCDVDALIQRIYDILKKRHDSGRLSEYTRDFFCKPAMTKYLEKCCRYAWKMVCQTPPYLIQGNSSVLKSDKIFDPAIHQVSRKFATSEHNSGYICMVLWPGLFEGSSGRIIRKTEVLLQ